LLHFSYIFKAKEAMGIVHNLSHNAIPPREKPEKVIPSNAFAKNNLLKKCLDFNPLGAENVQAMRSADFFTC